MKVTIYTINECKFSQAEKDYLKTNNIAFEEKNVEQNRDFLTEMLGISENFAGTPVTKIEKDDGTSNVLKGFTREEFDKELGLPASSPIGGVSDVMTVPSVDTQTMPISLSDNPGAPQPVDTLPTPPIISVPQSAPDATAAPSPSTGSTSSLQASSGLAPASDQLNSVLENLQNQVNTPVVPAPVVPAPVKPAIDPYAPIVTNV